MDIFLSYASEHLREALEIHNYLKELGHNVWFDKESIIGGTEWNQSILKGQEEAELILHLCSKEILARRGVVNREIKRSLQLYEDEPLRSMLIIPIRLEEMQLPLELSRFQYIDYFEPDWMERLDRAIAERESQLGRYPNLLAQVEQVTVQPSADARRVEITDSSDSYEFRGSYLEYMSDEPYWRMINSEIASIVVLDYLRHRGWFQQLPKADLGMKYSWETTCEQFYRSNEIVSIRLIQYSFSGGAHGSQQISTLNYFGSEPISIERDRATLDIKQLIRTDDDSARVLFDMCRYKVFEYHRGSRDQVSIRTDFAMYNEHHEGSARWDVLGAFNVGAVGLTFNFSPYDLLPYFYGPSEAVLSWDSVSGLLTDLGLKLMKRLES